MFTSLKSLTILLLIVLICLSALVFVFLQLSELSFNLSPSIFTLNNFSSLSDEANEALEFGYFDQDSSALEINTYDQQTAEILLNELRKNWLKSPPLLGEAYKFVRPYHNKSDDRVYQLQRTILKILCWKTQGFFVDVGVKDGISMSNTLDLEMDLGWTGILIEPSTLYFQSLMKQRRKVWITSACLGIKDVPMKLINPTNQSSIIVNFELLSDKAKIDKKNNTNTTKCFSLVSIVAAIGQHLLMNADYLSLNIEMARVDILQNILWDRVYFKIISLEATPGQAKPLLTFMKLIKYTFVRQFNSSSSSNHNIYLFVHKKHRYNRKLANNRFLGRDKKKLKKM